MFINISVSIIIFWIWTGSVHGNSENSNVLVDLEGFKYLLESPVCDVWGQKELLGVIIVTSYVGHVNMRMFHRKSISQSELNQMGLARVFLLGEIPEHEKRITEEDVNLEFEEYRDLLQGNFQDVYRNNTYKNMMGLKWGSENCFDAKFIIKLDDDTVYDVFFYQKYLKETEMDLDFDRNNFIAGAFSPTFEVHRSDSKWTVLVEEYPDPFYPEFLGGAFYMTTSQVARKFVKLSESTPFFWIDDVYITGILRVKANITVTNIGKWSYPAGSLKCIKESEKFTAWANYSCDRHAGFDNSDDKLLVLYTEAMRLKNRKNETILVDLEDFQYSIKSSACDLFEKNELLGVIIVTSNVEHVNLRSSHRQSISQSELNQMGLVRVFLVAEIPEHDQKVTQDDLNLEFEENKDLVQGNFLEGYRNATYKNVMGLKWVLEKCSDAKFIIKLEDDTVYDVFFYQKYLKEKDTDLEFDRNNFLAGTLAKNLNVHRENSNWAMTVEEFPADTYPPFIRDGFYITTTQVARNFVTLSEFTPFFWIDDIYITGFLREKANVTITDLGAWSISAKALECSYDNEEITAWSNYSCDYHVGINNRDSNLFVIYTEAMRQKSLQSLR